MPKVDVGLLRDLGKSTWDVSELIRGQHRDYAHHAEFLKLSESGLDSTLAKLCEELVMELRTFSDVARLKADDIEAVANGGSPSNSDLIAWRLNSLEASLNDNVGSDGIAEDDDLSPEALERWKYAKPPFTPQQLQQKMNQAAAAGNAEAVKFLSNALWWRLNSLTPDEATGFLFRLEPSVVVTAVESTGAPATLPVSRFLASMAGGNWRLQGGPLAEYLKDRHAFDPADIKNWALDQLKEMSDKGGEEAKTALQGIDWWVVRGGDGKRAPKLASLARRVALLNPDVLGFVVDSDSAWGQRLADLMATGSDGNDAESKRIREELLNIQAALLIYGETINVKNKEYNENKPAKDQLNPEAGSLTYAKYYRLMQAIGHGFSINGDAAIGALAAAVKLAKLDRRISAIAELAKFLVGLKGVVERDDLPDKRANESDDEVDQKNVALMILMQRYPEGAQAILDAMKTKKGANVVLGDLKQEEWNGLPLTAPNQPYQDGWTKFNKILEEVRKAWKG